MSRRTRPPETVTLQISQGDWLLVKKHPTAGDERAMFKGMLRDGATGDRIDSVNVGMSRVVNTLLDWSFTDHHDKPIVIRDKSPDDMIAALSSIDPEDFTEVLKAIDDHREAMEKERQAEKNGKDGGKELSPTSPSPGSFIGDTNGSPNSTEMSTTS